MSASCILKLYVVPEINSVLSHYLGTMICVHEFIECKGRLQRDDHIHGKTLRSVREGAEGAFQKGRGIEEDS